MGHYYRICGRERPNEQFSGKRHKVHVCKRCQARPKSARQGIEDRDHIFGFLEQSQFSEKNVARLEHMAKSDDPQVASLAAIVFDVARVNPHKTRRLKFLAHKHRKLLSRLRDAGLIFPNNYNSETTDKDLTDLDAVSEFSLSVYPRAYIGKGRYRYKWGQMGPMLTTSKSSVVSLNLRTRMCRMLHIGEHNAYQSRN
jgi:hypothetical protein